MPAGEGHYILTQAEQEVQKRLRLPKPTPQKSERIGFKVKFLQKTGKERGCEARLNISPV